MEKELGRREILFSCCYRKFYIDAVRLFVLCFASELLLRSVGAGSGAHVCGSVFSHSLSLYGLVNGFVSPFVSLGDRWQHFR